jgi:hypothetical protein
VFGRRFSNSALVVAAVVGVAVIAVSLILSVPGKAKAVDNMTHAIRSVFTTQGAAQTREYLTTVQAMDKQLTAQAVPGLAALLNETPTQFEASLGNSFPAVAAGLTQMPQILNRFDHLVTWIEHNVTNFQLADSVPTKGTHAAWLEGQLAIPAGVLVVAGVVGLSGPWFVRRRQARHSVSAQSATVAAGLGRLP